MKHTPQQIADLARAALAPKEGTISGAIQHREARRLYLKVVRDPATILALCERLEGSASNQHGDVMAWDDRVDAMTTTPNDLLRLAREAAKFDGVFMSPPSFGEESYREMLAACTPARVVALCELLAVMADYFSDECKSNPMRTDLDKPIGLKWTTALDPQGQPAQPGGSR